MVYQDGLSGVCECVCVGGGGGGGGDIKNKMYF